MNNAKSNNRSTAESMMPLHSMAMEGFERFFGQSAEAAFFAPGRVNLIGEHTDYNSGFVLPCAISYGTCLAVRRRADNMIRVVAGNFGEEENSWRVGVPVERSVTAPWADYLRGVSAQMARPGWTLSGMDLYALGDVPRGAGLSSSASFSVAFATACNELNSLNLTAREVAQICQRAESEFAGCHCGVMDQLASAAGEWGSAILLDCQSLMYRPIPLPESLSLMIIDSKVERQLVGSEYNLRREDCERAARALHVKSLREATLSMLMESRHRLDDVAYRRARHVITENARTLEAADALRRRDLSHLHTLMAESHASMRDDFEITTPEIDSIVGFVEQKLSAEGGVRMTGGGFGGCVVALVPKRKAEMISHHVKTSYSNRFHSRPEIHICQASSGAGRL